MSLKPTRNGYLGGFETTAMLLRSLLNMTLMQKQELHTQTLISAPVMDGNDLTQ